MPSRSPPSDSRSPAVYVHADEACLGNGREQACPGGAGGLVEIWKPDGVARRDYYHAEPDTTNNRMAIRSAILALELVGARGGRLRIDFTSDSEYLVNGMTKWRPAWEKRGFRNVKNAELWQELFELSDRHQLSWSWVRGHNLDPRNEYADSLATKAAREQRSSAGLVESGFLEWLAAERKKKRYLDFDPDQAI